MISYVRNKLTIPEVRRFIWVFYAVGLLGMIPELTRTLFIRLIPFALLMACAILLLFHVKKSEKEVAGAALVAILGFVVEAIGVNTGSIFGSYSYGSGLGLKLFSTPLIIGLNWLFMAYTALAITEKVYLPGYIRPFLASAIMLAYDIVLEQSAPMLDMWQWANGTIPLKNYAAWWILGLLLCFILRAFKVNVRNPLAATLYVSQLLFFALLLLFETVLP